MLSCRTLIPKVANGRNACKARFLVRKLSADATPTATGSTAGKVAGIAFFSTICITAIGLGVWQTKRYYWKVGVIEENKKRIDDAADVIPKLSQFDLVLYINQMRGRRVGVTGTFDHSKEVLVGLRSAPPGLIGAVAQGLAINPQGYYVITPLTRNDGTVVFVNRGWVAVKETTWNRPAGVVTLNTIVSEPEKMNTFSPVNDPETMKLLWIEPEALRKCSKIPNLELSDVVILEEFEKDDIPVTSYPAVRRQSQLNEEHVSPLTHGVYALTWFSLAAAGFVMTYYKFRGPTIRKLRNKIPPMPK